MRGFGVLFFFMAEFAYGPAGSEMGCSEVPLGAAHPGKYPALVVALDGADDIRRRDHRHAAREGGDI